MAVFRLRFMSKFYITTSIPYLNGKPHIGHVLEFIQADVLARYHRLINDDAWFLSGTDEHGIKIYRTAQAYGKNEKDFIDELAKEFEDILKKLNISNDDFIRTSDRQRHWPGVEKLWLALVNNGDIYKKSYKGLYCPGCEAFLKKSDLIDGKCPIHNIKDLDVVEEENWFFKLSKYKKDVKKKIESGEIKIIPERRKKEILNLIDEAEDVSFSRPVETLKWGIPVPNDPSQTIYVWADALTNYISALGYGSADARFNKFWPADVHLIGKDIFRFHALYWPAMLLSVGLALPKAIYVHGFIAVEGEKMSKSIGNVIDPFELIKKYGVDPLRYFLLREISSTEDGDFSYKKLEDRYNGDLANNLGNLISRVAKLIETKLNSELNFDEKFIDHEAKQKVEETLAKYKKAIEEFRLHEALTVVWDLLAYANSFIDIHKPWARDENASHLLKTLTTTLGIILNAAWFIKPFLPETSDKIFAVFGSDPLRPSFSEASDNYKTWIGKKFVVAKFEPLFPRLK